MMLLHSSLGNRVRLHLKKKKKREKEIRNRAREVAEWPSPDLLPGRDLEWACLIALNFSWTAGSSASTFTDSTLPTHLRGRRILMQAVL